MNHKDLDAWKISMELVQWIYEVTRDFPNQELYGLTNQLRRSAVSIPSNIAEGAARNSDKDFLRFLYIALGSLAEVETQLIIAINLGYLNEQAEQIDLKVTQARKPILGLIKYLKKKE